MPTFSKHRRMAPPGFFRAEAAGLRWLSAAEGARVVNVIDVGDDHIEVEHIDTAPATASAARDFGAALARTHLAGAARFGCPPDGWDGPLYIGARQMPRTTAATWGEFYASARVEPFVEPAVRAGNLTETESTLVRRSCEAVASGAFDDHAPPARIHGDLWNGNVLWSTGGAVMIDPAAHGGHVETDLAMLALFGAPFLDHIVAGYQATHPLKPGWADRVPVHQLHPLAVHAVSHGPSYGLALARAARDTLALIERAR